MAEPNDSSGDRPADAHDEQLNSSNGIDRKNEVPDEERRGNTPDPSSAEAPEADRSAAERRLHGIAGASHSNEGSAYQGAMEAVLAVPISMGLGYWADGHFDTGYRYLIIGAVVGFTAMVVRLARMRSLVGESAEADSRTPSSNENVAADAASDDTTRDQ
jgi:F0F1-type ATP synthase assembly protein I